jgi:hypothetical protein
MASIEEGSLWFRGVPRVSGAGARSGRRGAPLGREVGQRGGQVGPGDRGQRAPETLLELEGVQAARLGVGAQRLDGTLALGVGRAQLERLGDHGLGRAGRGSGGDGECVGEVGSRRGRRGGGSGTC